MKMWGRCASGGEKEGEMSLYPGVDFNSNPWVVDAQIKD
jgi:hypothetical protein